MAAAGVLFAFVACRDMTADATHTAARSGLRPALVQGEDFRHEMFLNAATAGRPLYIFIEGDGLPWRNNGTRVSDNPTPHHPLALQLAARTPRSVMYLGRPCYFLARSDAACSPRVWTSGRYSAQVAASMAAVINRYAAAQHVSGVVLLGYSGGGALAVLIAPLVPSTLAVVTIAADLDIDAWARLHGYTPLAESLNPAAQPPLAAPIQEWHLVGDRDSVVPPHINDRYLERLDASHVWHFAAFDHVCCWAEQWPDTFKRIEAAIMGDEPR